MEVRIRAFDLADLDDVVALHALPGCIAGTLIVPHQSPEELRQRWRQPGPGVHRLVAEVGAEDLRGGWSAVAGDGGPSGRAAAAGASGQAAGEAAGDAAAGRGAAPRGRVVGVLGLRQHSGRRAHAAEIGMFVHDEHQGRGLGRQLLEAAIELSERWLGVSRLELSVYTDNAPALALYERCGFQIEGTLRRFALRNGELVDAYTMARLRDGA